MVGLKILFVHRFDKPDYLADSIYHGLIDLGCEVHTLSYPKNLYTENLESEKCYNLYGKLKGSPIILSGQEIWQTLMDRGYDHIIYGNIRDDHRTFWPDRMEIVKRYSKNRLHFLDGEDDNFVLTGISEYGTLWKRELTNEQAEPISFSIPESQLVLDLPKKEQINGIVIPGNLETYIFQDEESYNRDYQKSFYGITYRKAGWDCYRHYEILANRCVPSFPDLEFCPEKTMVDFPKKMILEINQYSIKGIIHPQYNEINEELFEYTKENLTTKAMAKKIIEKF